MPIKEIITFTLGLVSIIAITGGPWNLTQNLQKLQYEILKEATRTDNWGNPSPWAKENLPLKKTNLENRQKMKQLK